jgi:glycosyltransferase involved in cell wall biosynthesis
MLKLRLRGAADAYVITFRGQELLLFLPLLWPKPVVFDELINSEEWLKEHHKLRDGTLGTWLFSRLYSLLVHQCRYILADTDAHAAYSSQLSRIPRDRYVTIPVGTDEAVFKPAVWHAPKGQFQVFYVCTMLPLHGLQYVLDAAVALKDHPEISFLLAGGGKQARDAMEAARAQGAQIDYKEWIPFEQLPEVIAESGISLGGPFGNTLQSQFVVTGKTYHFLAAGAPALIGQNKVLDGFADKENCLVVPQGDAQALAATIEWAYNHPEQLEKIGKRGRQLFEQRFTTQHIADLLQEHIVKHV